jgi:hypothetical protein
MLSKQPFDITINRLLLVKFRFERVARLATAAAPHPAVLQQRKSDIHFISETVA